MKKNKGLVLNYVKGFTLIELLVVIAIIGVLASVVLASVNAARTKASDAVVKGDMSSIRTQASIYHEDNGTTYNNTGLATTVCDAAGTLFVDSKIAGFMSQINLQTATTSTMSCYTTAAGESWAMSISALKGGGTWCIDSLGKSGPGTADATGVCL